MALAHAHAHCTSCFSVKCDRPGGCPVEICPNGCGAYFHLCKLDEHTRHTCWAAVVPCLNSLYGCEVVLPRAKLAQHLQHCPASILMCRFSCEKVESSHERLSRLRGKCTILHRGLRLVMCTHVRVYLQLLSLTFRKSHCDLGRSL